MAEPIKCKEDGCSRSTWEGKPYCSNHCQLAEYPARVRKKYQAIRADAKILREGRKLGIDSDLAQELAGWVAASNGYGEPVQVSDFVREWDIPMENIMPLLAKMQEAGLVQLHYPISMRGRLELL